MVLGAECITLLAEADETASSSFTQLGGIVYIYANEGVKRLAVRDQQGEDPVVVEFDDDGKARVDRQKGQYLRDRVPSLTIKEENYDISGDEEE